MLSKIPRPSRIPATMLAKLSSARTMSAASRVTAVPVRPMAIPMCASRSAGASFTPSPVMATTAPRPFQAAHDPQLVLRRGTGVNDLRSSLVVFGQDSHLSGDGRRRDRMVAGDHHRADPRLPRLCDGVDGLGAGRIGDPDQPQQCAGVPRPARHRRRRRGPAARASPSRRAASVAPDVPSIERSTMISTAPLTYRIPSWRRMDILFLSESKGVTAMRGFDASICSRRIPRSAAAREDGQLRRISAAAAARRGRAGRRNRRPPRRSAPPDRDPRARARPSRRVVSVPVLSVQMTVAQPSVSTAGSLRTSTLRDAMR